IGGFLVLYLSIFVAVLVIGFLTPPVLRELQQRHYQDVAMIGHSNLAEGIFNMFKWAFIMLLLFFLLIPLYFVPLVNIIALNFPLYYFFHKAMTYDIASNICTKEEDKKIKYFSGNAIRMKTLAIYLVSLIPFTIFFGAIFYVIYLGHTYFVEVRKVRS
ncbi:MAG: EI24 domain-containing protein, partial [Sulfurimonas sp.]|nr:EI24 domain-containing protein [Sulfurimonas sp.]